MPLVLALDLGSTQLKVSLVAQNGTVVSSAIEGYETYAPHAQYLEQDPESWKRALKSALSRALEAADPHDIACVGFSGHMSGTVLLDEHGNVLYRCIMLSDSRSDYECHLISELCGERIRAVTGNPVINAFTLPKLVWLKRNEPELWRKVRWIISPKDYIRYLLTGVITTEYTDAFNTLMLDGNTRKWDDEIINAAGIDRSLLPEVLAPSDIIGRISDKAASEYKLPACIPVVSGAADMAAAAVGMNLFNYGTDALTLGTCATFLSFVPGIMSDGYGSITYHLHALPGSFYALGSHFNGGLAVNWISRMLSSSGNLDYNEMDKLAEEAISVAPGSDGVLAIPFLAGSGSPYFSSSDRFCLSGASAATGRGTLFKSMLEGIAMNLKQTLMLYDRMHNAEDRKVLLGGGGVKVAGWPEVIADVFQRDVLVVRNSDASTLGAAIIAGSSVGLFDDIASVSSKFINLEREIKPDKSKGQLYAVLFEKFLKLYEAMRSVLIESS
ncbi:MAG: hypothetical protein IAA97_01825 [Spirochaetes bacterium]|uniref:Xylulokinase n=1 Tax=Candidatus Ornithospirochaeta stercoripullorum TaxID=2840899 RepID=A0A9D9DZ47_9SPIO|nr:hypothetical protein [Candidatus Ornithospirochaeta stercoripullorum]